MKSCEHPLDQRTGISPVDRSERCEACGLVFTDLPRAVTSVEDWPSGRIRKMNTREAAIEKFVTSTCENEDVARYIFAEGWDACAGAFAEGEECGEGVKCVHCGDTKAGHAYVFPHRCWINGEQPGTTFKKKSK